jgi:hypothetical protein
MIVDAAGRFLTQRQHPRLAQIDAMPTDRGVALRHAGLGALDVDFPDENAPLERVVVWRDQAPARLASPAGRYFSAFLDAPVRLVYFHDIGARPVDPNFARADDRVGFADGFPVLMTSVASLEDVNRRLARPVGMDRFRANIVVEGAPAWAEDRWRRIRVGALAFRVVKPCSRCAIPTFDPLTGERPDGDEPLRTLATFRRAAGGGIMFGQNLIPDDFGAIRVGDRIEVLEEGPSNLP